MDIKEFLEFTRGEFQLYDESIHENIEFRKLKGWSSLNALIFIAAINDKYEVLISSIELAKQKTLGNIFHLINNKK